ncbi:hypothetical protein GOP47_0015684 [Adiantum capillus-veneris]|uniref:RING-type domain-containing protein n=1 Tax=Adiantum capillus-veneris TaxID=13818 RepID=A0A9D4ZBF9_ADICA|nr:hypothetical protein GOP47_0015684 [Adiantum capillus-veneris]
MERGCPPNCLCNACLPIRIRALLEAPTNVQRTALRALSGVRVQAANVGFPGLGAFNSSGPSPSLMDALFEEALGRPSSASPTFPPAIRPSSPTMGRNEAAFYLQSVDAFMPAQQPISDQPPVPVLEPLPQPQPQHQQLNSPGIPLSLQHDANRIHSEIPHWLHQYIGCLRPGLDHIIRNLANAGPYKRSGMLEGIYMIIETYTKYYEEFNAPERGPGERPNLDHLDVERYVPVPNDGICTICYDMFTEGDEIIWTPCRHKYHVSCLGELGSYSRQCPVCRGDW